jgi:hypothetical protein
MNKEAIVMIVKAIISKAFNLVFFIDATVHVIHIIQRKTIANKIKSRVGASWFL